MTKTLEVLQEENKRLMTEREKLKRALEDLVDQAAWVVLGASTTPSCDITEAVKNLRPLLEEVHATLSSLEKDNG